MEIRLNRKDSEKWKRKLVTEHNEKEMTQKCLKGKPEMGRGKENEKRKMETRLNRNSQVGDKKITQLRKKKEKEIKQTRLKERRKKEKEH